MYVDIDVAWEIYIASMSARSIPRYFCQMTYDHKYHWVPPQVFCLVWVAVSHTQSSLYHNSDVIMVAMSFQITSLTIVYSTVYSGADQRKYQSSASLAFVCGNSPVTGEFPAQMASNAENVSIWLHHHVFFGRVHILWMWQAKQHRKHVLLQSDTRDNVLHCCSEKKCIWSITMTS